MVVGIAPRDRQAARREVARWCVSRDVGLSYRYRVAHALQCRSRLKTAALSAQRCACVLNAAWDLVDE